MAKDIFCRLCLNSVSNKSFNRIEETIKEVLDIVIPKLDLDRNEKNVICDICCKRLFAALSFKSICMDTEDVIYPYVNSMEGSVLDLREIFVKEKQGGLATKKIRDNNVCRLCMDLVKNEFIALEDIDVDMIKIYIPQVNMAATKDPVICKVCYDLLDKHCTFLKNCLVTVERTGRKSKSKDLNSQVDIKTEEIKIKLEESSLQVESCNSSGDETIPSPPSAESMVTDVIEEKLEIHDEELQADIGAESNFSSNSPSMSSCDPAIKDGGSDQKKMSFRTIQKEYKYKCNECSYQTYLSGNLKKHQSKHKNLLDVQMYECNKCEFKTKYKSSIHTHQIVHNDPSDLTMYKCDKCNYQTNRKDNHKRHQLKHKSSPDVLVYECDKCTYKARYKNGLQQHKLMHKDPTDVKMYKCDECNYQTKYKNNLQKHHLKHKSLAHVQLYECDKCALKTKYKDVLQTHQLIHKGPSDVTMYGCDKCFYRTRNKGSLIVHTLVHKDPLDVTMYKCDICDFQTKYKSVLKTHHLKHGSSKAVKIYERNKCALKTKYKGGL